MDHGTMQAIITVIVAITFIGLFAWAYSSRRKKEFDEAANLVFSDEQDSKSSMQAGEHK